MNEKQSNILSRIAQQLNDHIGRYERDAVENKQKFAEEREDRRKWREEMDSRIDTLDAKMAPVILHHQIIMKGGTWAVASVGGVIGAVKGWLYLRDHFK